MNSGREDERDRGQKLDQDVQGRPSSVLERIADRVADDGRGVGIGALAEDVRRPSSLRLPDSMYFLALSHAPPPLLSTVASMTPAIVPTISMPATASAPSSSPTTIGVATATTPGAIISRRAALVVMSTTRA